ncbi:nucleotidyltransferase domain-containing protein [Candidatus Woesearchaeota archaeon]|nr:nucleotidyltransferase domain-containing protein [Candidatus Woesearchaeota archaeon]
METKITILKPFFEEPTREYHIRELARMLKINHTTVRQQLNKLVSEGILEVTKGKLYSAYKPNMTKKFLNIKLYYNLEKIRLSNIVEELEKAYDYPAIVLFGSYAKAYDDKNSDLDICVISNIAKEANIEKYEKTLNRKASLHNFTKEKWKKMIRENKELINNICNGIVLSGQLEAII